jgi:hypothetical protein
MAVTKKTSERYRIPLYQLVLSQDTITDDVLRHKWEGSGTEEDPYLVDWLHEDARDPHQMQRLAQVVDYTSPSGLVLVNHVCFLPSFSSEPPDSGTIWCQR